MTDYLDAKDILRPEDNGGVSDTDPQDWKKWWNTLRLNWERRSTRMKIDVFKSGNGFEVIISRYRNNGWEESCKCSYAANNFSISNVFLQTHWHSGVKFTKAEGLE